MPGFRHVFRMLQGGDSLQKRELPDGDRKQINKETGVDEGAYRIAFVKGGESWIPKSLCKIIKREETSLGMFE